MTHSFVLKHGKVFERFETESGFAFVLVENPSEEQKDDVILQLWGITAYRVEEANEPQ